MEITVESLPLLGVCNLCLNEGAVKSMLACSSADVPSYSDILLKCFSIDISLMELGDTKQLVCDSCAARLMESMVFKDQALQSLRSLEDSAKMFNVKKESVEFIDDAGSLADFDIDPDADDDDDDDDDKALSVIVKKEPITEVFKPRKTRKKYITITVKKSKDYKDISDTETMLSQGLFPFKIRKNRLFACAICPETLSNLEDMKKHVSQHNKKNIHIAFKKMMFSNSQRFYKSATQLRCKICTTDLNNFEDLNAHVENCTRLKYTNGKWSNLPFKLEKDQLDCPVCKKTFLNFVSLNTHMNIHYPNYICENCGKAFASKARLRGHMRTHEVGEFPCKYCDAVFDRVTKRENHVSKEHKAGVRYACKRCNISLTSFYARQKHLAEIHNEELKRYKCKACPQSYITPGHLSSHVRRDHLNERNHKCDKCDLAFYTRNALKMHMIKHDGERIHVCHICQKSYQRKKTLREHMRIHTNDKRFICPVCGRAFTQKCTLKGHLKVHERKVEIDEKIMQPLHSI
ncbi:zinc finger protein 26-like [Cydia strobilella]|uniref:zinc finger protein 26-like n=1 Tax=Cydia strobilella TaxID=1100964 RepID=UPI003004698A